MHEELQQHKDRVTDKLQGLVTTIDKIPGILLADNKQISAVTKALLSREGGIHRTKEILGLLPAELAGYDQELDELNLRAADIHKSLHVLTAAESSASALASTSSTGQQAKPAPAAATAGATASQVASPAAAAAAAAAGDLLSTSGRTAG